MKGASVIFHDLVIHRRLDDFVIGHEPTASYMAVDEEGMHVIKALQSHTIPEVEKQFPKYDVQGIITQLTKKGLIHKVGHRTQTPHKHIVDVLDMQAKKTRWIRHPLCKGTILAVIALGIALMLTNPSLTPKPSWFFGTQAIGALLPLAFLLFWVLQFLHELGHYLVMKSTGHATGFSIVNKWHLLLPHANIANARLLDAHNAVAVHLAGIITDLFILGISIIMLTIGVWQPFFALVVVLLVIDMLFQLIPLHKTDLTRAIEHATGIENLPATLKKALLRACPSCEHPDMTKNEHRVTQATLPLVLIGIISGILVLGGFVIPILWSIFSQSIHALLAGAVGKNVSLFVDGLLALLFMSIFVALYSVSLIRDHHLGMKNWFAWFGVLLYLLANYFSVFLITVALIVFSQPTTTVFVLLFLGVTYGFLFTRLLETIHIEDAGFAKDLVIPVFAALTALLLAFMTAWILAQTGSVQPVTIHATAYAVGMIMSIVF